MSKTFLITGGAGFIGTNLAKKLIDFGYSVVICDNLITGKKENVEFLEKYNKDKIQFLNKSIVDTNFLGFLDKIHIDGIFHLASLASPPFYIKYPLQTMLVGSVGTKNLLDLAVDRKCKILFTSTSEVYGDPAEHPQAETYFGNVNCIGKRSPYDESKRFSEAMMIVYKEQSNVDIRIARVFNTYGPFMRMDDGRIVTSFIWSALNNSKVLIHGTGKQSRCFCFIDDTVEGLWCLFNSDYELPVNIGNPYQEFSVLDAWKIVSKKIPNNCNIEFVKAIGNDPKVRKPDITLAKSLFDWEPSIDFNTGLDYLISWYKERK